MLQSLLWDDEVSEAHFPSLQKPPPVTAKELEMSVSLVNSLSTNFSPEKFSDDYQKQLRKLIDEKLKHSEAMDTAMTSGKEDSVSSES